MRVIEMGKLPEKEVVCKKCDSTLAYTDADVSTHFDELFGEMHPHSDVTCPVCGSPITVMIDGTCVKE